MAAPVSSVTGLASGLDTNKIITQLMAVEQKPVTRMQSRISTYQSKVGAWQAIRTKLSALQTAANALANPSDLAAMATATSSSPAAAATVTGSTTPGSVSFTIDQLAAPQISASVTSFSSPQDLVGAGTFSLTSGSTTTNVTTTSGTTLSQLVQQINGSNAGVSAAVVAASGGSYKLLLTAGTTGAAAAFGASGTPASLAAFNTLQQGQDAKITIGTGPQAIQLSRSSNQVTDLLPGVSISLGTPSSTPVTVSVAQNPDAVVKSVQAVVDAYNQAAATLGGFTAYDAASKTAGLLMGDPTASNLGGLLNQALADTVKGLTGSSTSATSIGITMQADGSFALDQTKLRTALGSNPAAVTNLLARTGTAADSRIASVAGAPATASGSYAAVVTRAAQQATATSAVYAPPASDETFALSVGSTSASVTVLAGDDLSTALGKINSALKGAGLTQLAASATSGGAIQIQDAQYGSAAVFRISGDDSFGPNGISPGSLALNGTYTGVDIAGTIDGQPATGAGQVLSSSTGASSGLQLRITATAADVTGAGGSLSLGSASFSQGIAGRLSSFLALTQGVTGSITDATNVYNSSIDDVRKQIAAMQVQLTQKETVLRQQFATMEAALVKLQSQGNFMSSQLGMGTSASSSPTGSNSTSGSSGG